MSDAEQKRSLGTTEWLALIALVGAATLLTMSSRGGLASSGQPVPEGTPMPSLMAEGWLNVDGPTPGPKSLGDKVVVIDFWATSCPPCRAAMPKLAKLYEQYQPLGVEFLGLTPEPTYMLQQVEGFLDSIDGVNWPIGYGAGLTLDALNIQAFPTLVVFDTHGRSVWSGHDLQDMQEALDQTLATRQ